MLGLTWLLVVAMTFRVSMAAHGDETGMAVVARLRQGLIRGRVVQDYQGHRFYSFRRIPFARPPVGDLRFRDPLPAASWEGVRDGTKPLIRCPQFDLPKYFRNDLQVLGQEDCLYLNVYVPERSARLSRLDLSHSEVATIMHPKHTNMPVMVWFHGGVFAHGWAELYEPGPLMTRDVVIVILQYRLNALGFMSTEDEAMPGNLGMKDQVMALRWVQDNIRSFGGDPGKVTLFGESGGGSAAHFHVLSPMSTGLFHRIIMQSGAAIAPWTMWFNQSAIATWAGQLTGCLEPGAPNDDSEALAACLRTKPPDQLVKMQKNFTEWHTAPTVLKVGVDGEFLPDHPATLLRQGRYNKVDVMSGVTKDQGIVCTIFMKNAAILEELIDNFDTLGHVALCSQPNNDPQDLARQTWHHYMGPLTSHMPDERFEYFTDMFSDIMFNVAHMDSVDYHARDDVHGYKTFMFEFEHQGQHHVMDQFFFGKRWKSQTEKNAEIASENKAAALEAEKTDANEVKYKNAGGGEGQTYDEITTPPRQMYSGHLDDLLYLFNLPHHIMTNPEDLYVSRIMVDLWVNFAETGDPTPDMTLGFKWDPVKNMDFVQLSIGTSPRMTKPRYLPRVEHFWRDLPTTQNIILYPERFKWRHCHKNTTNIIELFLDKQYYWPSPIPYHLGHPSHRS